MYSVAQSLYKNTSQMENGVDEAEDVSWRNCLHWPTGASRAGKRNSFGKLCCFHCGIHKMVEPIWIEYLHADVPMAESEPRANCSR